MLQILTGRMDIAERYGLDAAVFLHNIVYWTLKNQAENRHFHEGRYWTYASRKGLAKMYPLWSESQIRRLTDKLRERGALLVGDFNDDRMQRTIWYSPSDEILALYDAQDMIQDRQMHLLKSSNASDETVKCKYNEDKKRLQEEPPLPPAGDAVCKGRKKDKSVPDWKPERFEAFWAYYRTHARGEDRQGAVRAWDKLQPDDNLIAAMGKALQAQIQSEEWKRGIGIPYAKTWLRNDRWKDTPKKPLVPESAEEEGEHYGWR